MESQFRQAKRRLKQVRASVWDLTLSPITLIALLWLRRIRHFGFHRMPIARYLSARLGIYPLKNHYYEPYIDRPSLDRSFRQRRQMQGICWNPAYQKKVINQFHFQEELKRFPCDASAPDTYHFNNGNFGAGDAGLLYSMVRWYQPERIIEVGSGYSTLMMLAAIKENERQDPARRCRLTCIEPYRYQRIKPLAVELVREPVQNQPLTIFRELQANDILFIDSSHMIKPQGDVLFEILEILPILNPGVFVHFHDIYSPMDYPNRWLIDGNTFWNEQYLLEAFLHSNHDYRIIAALNYLKHHESALLHSKFPHLDEVGSFWIQKC